ncbi:hypothetical protein ACWDSJ_04010 [Nocardia sp. NPDC003482]
MSSTAFLLDTMKRVAGVMKAADIDFALAGSLASYARGGWSEPHDVDFVVLETDLPRVEAALAAAGLRVVHPPEDWLIKAFDDDAGPGPCMVDFLFRPTGLPVTAEMLARADPLLVESVVMPVLAATDLLVLKLLSLSEQHCDFGPLLRLSRPLREQVDWDEVSAATRHSPFARGFVGLLNELDIASIPGEAEESVQIDVQSRCPGGRNPDDHEGSARGEEGGVDTGTDAAHAGVPRPIRGGTTVAGLAGGRGPAPDRNIGPAAARLD